MRHRRHAWIALMGLLLLASAGCLRRWQDPQPTYPNDPFYQRRDAFPPGYPPPYPPPGVGGPGRPEVLTPQPPPIDNGAGTTPLPSITMPPMSSGYAPVPPGGLIPADHWQTRPRTSEEPPLAPATPPGSKPRVTVIPPSLLDRKLNEKADTIAPPGVPEASPGLPSGIDAFFEVKEKASATGLKPNTEGLDWLKANRYRTVLHLRRKGSDDSADREQVERRGLKYRSIELSTTTLTKETVDAFGAIVSDAANQPVFVYDKDGVLSGALWYLHFRLNEKLPEKLARSRAELYGLKDSGSEERNGYWLAIQSLLKEPEEED